MSSNHYNYMDYGVETIKWQTRVTYGNMTAGQSHDNRLGLRPRLYTGSVCDTVPLQYAASGTM